MNSRGQMEILGLAIVVVLIVILIFFGLFMIVQPKEAIPDIYRQKGLATNVLNAVMGTSTLCDEILVRELIQDCGGDRKIVCNGENSCSFLKTTLQLLLNQTFTPINTKFYFQSMGPGALPDLSFGDKAACEEMNVEASTQLLPLFIDSGSSKSKAGVATLRLFVCT